MKLVFGGSSQGKLQFAMLQFGLAASQVLVCEESTQSLVGEHKIVYHMEEFILGCVRTGKDPLAYCMENRVLLEDKVIICNDICAGVVPIDPLERAWREQNGKCLQYLAKESTTVYRVFCGLPTVIKNG